jgi:alpha-tubulin suppressor-like RCC1 family protein
MRYLGGFITASYNPFKVPNAPTGAVATISFGSTSASVSFTAPVNVGGGAITSYTVLSSNGNVASGSSSPITVSGLTPGVAVTFQVCANNAFGSGPFSVPSASITPINSAKLFTSGSGNITGQNNTISLSSPTQVGTLTTWSHIGSGPTSSQCIAVKVDGTLWSWGDNSSGVLGLNDTINRSSPTQVGALTDWLYAFNCGTATFCIKNNYTLWAFGNDSNGALGLNTNNINVSSPVQVGSDTNWLKMAGANSGTLGLKNNGTLWAWGNRLTTGQNNLVYVSSPVQVGALTDWSDVSVGTNFVVAIRSQGTMWSWGVNDFGQQGRNIATETNTSSPVQIGALTTWKSVSAGSRHCGAIKTDGALWLWGRNNYGQLGLGDGNSDFTNRSSPVQVGSLTNWSQLGANSQGCSVIKTDGTLWVWGSNSNGHLGTGNTTNYSSPVQVGSNTNWYITQGRSGAVISIKG